MPQAASDTDSCGRSWENSAERLCTTSAISHGFLGIPRRCTIPLHNVRSEFDSRSGRRILKKKNWRSEISLRSKILNSEFGAAPDAFTGFATGGSGNEKCHSEASPWAEEPFAGCDDSGGQSRNSTEIRSMCRLEGCSAEAVTPDARPLPSRLDGTYWRIRPADLDRQACPYRAGRRAAVRIQVFRRIGREPEVELAKSCAPHSRYRHHRWMASVVGSSLFLKSTRAWDVPPSESSVSPGKTGATGKVFRIRPDSR